MKIILREKVPELGLPGEIRDVSDGYARNFLLPKKLAYPATAGAEKTVAEEQRLRAARDEKKRRAKFELAARLKDISLTIPVTVGEDDQLYGSVSARDIAAALESQENIEIEEKRFHLEEPIKQLGVYRVPVILGEEVESTVTVWVVKDGGEKTPG